MARTPPRRILVVCTRRIGDVLLVTPFVRSLRRAYPDATIDMLVFAGTQAVLEGNPDVATVHTVGERDSLVRRLRTMRRLWRRYDLACSLQTSDRTTFYAWAAGRFVAGLLDPVRTPRWKRALIDCPVPFDNLDTHTVVAGLALCDALGIPRHHDVVCPVDRRSATAPDVPGVGAVDRPMAVLHVSPKFPYKSWTTSGWRELCVALVARGWNVVVCAGGAAEERSVAAGVVAGLGEGVTDAAGRLSLAQLAGLLARSGLYVGTDTAVTHLAAATGIPTVALFGPSNPVKWGPWPKGCTAPSSPWVRRGTQRSGNVTLLQGEASCVPCMLEGCDRRVDSLSRCLQEMPAARVIAAVEQAVAAAGRTGFA